MVILFILRRISVISIFCFLGISLLTNCSKEESDLEPKLQEATLTDDYTYTALRNDGTIFEIGDETGDIKKVGKIPNITFNIVFNTVTSSDNTTYMYEQMPEIISGDGTTTGFRGQLCQLDNKTLKSTCLILNFSNDFFPEFAGLIALDWDQKNKRLIGIVRDVVNTSSENPNYLVYIDQESLSITYSGIQFVQGFINSTCLLGDTYYISSRYDTYNKQPLFSNIELLSGTQNNISTSGIDSPPFLLSKNEDAKKLFGLTWEFNTGFFNAAIPIAYDNVSQKFEKLPTPARITFKQDFGKSFFNAASEEQIALVNSEMGGLLRYNFKTNTLKIVQLSPLDNELSSYIAIISVK